MELESIAVVLRPRTPWEALDLGFAMARQWWQPLYAAWLAVYLPAAIVLHLALPDNLLLVLFLLWWLKPLFDRVALHVLSTSVFGEPPTVRQTLRALRHAMATGLLASLTLYRLDAARSFNLPVWQLERQSGGAARARGKALHKRTRSYAVALTVICFLFELTMWLSLAGTLNLLIPQALDSGAGPFSFLEMGLEAPWWQQWMNYLLYVAAVSLIEPVYVAAGFALYLNRRTLLEAWDIELGLRRLAQRRAPAALAAALMACGIALTFALALAQSQAALAQEDKSARREIAETLKGPEFNEYRTEKSWRYTGSGLTEDKPSEKKTSEQPNPFWVNLGNSLAGLSRIIAWVMVAALVIAAVWFASRYLGMLSFGGNAAYRPPPALFGMDLRPQSLPADVAGAALELVRQGQFAAALSLLYRASLSVLTRRDHVELRQGDTEGDCERAVSAKSPGATAAYFAKLVRAWQSAAYAGKPPDAALAEGLCREWPVHFAGTGEH